MKGLVMKGREQTKGTVLSFSFLLLYTIGNKKTGHLKTTLHFTIQHTSLSPSAIVLSTHALLVKREHSVLLHTFLSSCKSLTRGSNTHWGPSNGSKLTFLMI